VLPCIQPPSLGAVVPPICGLPVSCFHSFCLLSRFAVSWGVFCFTPSACPVVKHPPEGGRSCPCRLRRHRHRRPAFGWAAVAPRCAGRNLTEKPRQRFSTFDFSLSSTSAFTPLASGSQSSFLQPPATNIVSQHLSPRIGEGLLSALSLMGRKSGVNHSALPYRRASSFLCVLLAPSWSAPQRGALVSVPLAAARTPAPPSAERRLRPAARGAT
jgi:hypothetical protein